MVHLSSMDSKLLSVDGCPAVALQEGHISTPRSMVAVHKTGSLQFSWRTSWPSLSHGCSLHGQFKALIASPKYNRDIARVFMAGFLKRTPSEKEVVHEDQRRKHRISQYALLSLCAQAMVASQFVQAPLLGFMWKTWPRVVEELFPQGSGSPPASGGHGGGRNNPSVDHFDNEPDKSSSLPCGLWWKTLGTGFFLGLCCMPILKPHLPVGSLVDACLWIALLFSLLLLVGWTARTLACGLLFIIRGDIFSHIRPTFLNMRAPAQSLLIGGLLLAMSMLCLHVRSLGKRRKVWHFPCLSAVISIWKNKRSYTKKVLDSGIYTQTRKKKKQGSVVTKLLQKCK